MLTIDRPKRLNALSRATLRALGRLGAELVADPAVRAEYYKEILPPGEDVCREAVRAAATVDDGALDALFTELHAPLIEPHEGRPLRLLAVGDCLMSELRLALPRALAAHGITLDMRTLYFSAVMGSSISSDQVAAAAKDGSPDALSFSFFTSSLSSLICFS